MLNVVFTTEDGDFNVSDRIQRLIRETITETAKVMELTTHTNTVSVAVIRESTMPKTAGATATDSVDPIRMRLVKALPHDLIPTICHEMFHVRDLLTGALKRNADHYTYQGKVVFRADVRLSQQLNDADFSKAIMPDEAIAYAGMYPMAKKIILNLSQETQDFVRQSIPDHIAKSAIKEILPKLRERLGPDLPDLDELLNHFKNNVPVH